MLKRKTEDTLVQDAGSSTRADILQVNIVNKENVFKVR
jgi:hypothetical protein